MMIKKFFKDITGITAREEEDAKHRLDLIRKTNEALIRKEKAESRKKAREEKKLKEKEATLSPKELATRKGEPWVDIVNFRTTKENVRYGFFELDWNDLFIEELKKEGYGFDGDPDEEIVARWYRDICHNAAIAEGVDMTDRNVGYINVKKISDTRSEAS